MHFTVEAQERIRKHVLSHGARREFCALDATAGNGWDTEFLTRLTTEIAEEGRGCVLAIDLQASAIDATRERLERAGLASSVHLQVGCHSKIDDYIESLKLEASHGARPFDVVMFNLGYLPLGDKSIITQRESTLVALDVAFRRLRTYGFLSVLSYPGHAGGGEEHSAVEAWFDSHRHQLRCEILRDEANPRSPVLWLGCLT